MIKAEKIFKNCLYLVVMLALSAAADARVVTVEAKGKDYATAENNARVAAARQVMLSITDEKFVREHTKDIISGVINKVGNYVISFNVIEKNEGGKPVVIKAEVDVDKTKLSGYLKSIGAVIVPSYEDLYEERKNSEAQTAARIFGRNVPLKIKSVQMTNPENISLKESVTEEIEPGTELSSDGQKIYESRERFMVYYRLPDYSELTAGTDRSLVTINTPDVPVDFEHSSEENLTEKVAENYEREGYFYVSAPDRSGNYEVRLFSKGKEKHEIMARLGFSVKSTAIPYFNMERTVLLPGEKFVVNVDELETFPDGFFVLTGSESADKKYDEIRKTEIDRSKAFREKYVPEATFKAPKEPGNYSVLMFTGCNGCEGYENNYRVQKAAARIDFTVQAPPAAYFSESFISAPAEIYTGTAPSFIVACSDEWKNDSVEVRIDSKKDGKNIDWGNADCREKPYFTMTAREIYPLGDYVVSATQGSGDNIRKLSAEFRVVANKIDEKTVPRIDVPFKTIEQDSSMVIAGNTRTYWSYTAFAALVPKGTSKDLKAVLEYAGDKRIQLGHSRNYTRNFSITEPAGDYELRVYDSAEEDGTLQASAPLHVMSDDEMALHKKEISGRMEKYLASPDNAEIGYKEDLINHFHIPKPPKPQPLFSKSVVMTDEGKNTRDGLMTDIALRTSDCDRYIDDEIRSMTRIDITLGREGDFEGELGSFAKTLAFKLPLPDRSNIKNFQSAMEEITDRYNDTIAGLDQLSEQDYTGALKTAMLMMIKTGMNHCGSEECLKKMITKNSGKFREKMARMSDQGFRNYYDTLKDAIGGSPKGKKMLDDLVNYRKIVDKSAKNLSGKKETASNALDVVEDVSTLAGTLAGGDYTNKDAYMNAAAAILAIDFPIYVAAAKLSYQAYLSSRDFARDVAVLRMYGRWKKVGADTKGSLGYEEFARIWKDDWKHHKDSVMRQAKEVMIKTMGNELTKRAFSKANKSRARMYYQVLRDEGYDAAQEYLISSDFISEDEVYDFLEAQFKEWEKAENLNTDYGRELKNIKEEFKSLNSELHPSCERDFYRWYKGQANDKYKDLKWGEKTNQYLSDKIKSLWYKGCPQELEAFLAYYQTKKEIEMELRKWNREDSRFCKAKDLRKNTVDLLCSLMEGEQKYLDHVADIACNCGWKAGIVGNRVLGTDEFRAYRREAEVVNVMSTIGKSNVLHCLCEYGRVSHGGASYTVSISYNPGATGLAPGGICGKNTRGSCFASGWSCWHYTMPTDEKGLEQCGYFKAIKEAKDKLDDLRLARDEARQCKADYDAIIKRAADKEREKRRQASLENQKL